MAAAAAVLLALAVAVAARAEPAAPAEREAARGATAAEVALEGALGASDEASAPAHVVVLEGDRGLLEPPAPFDLAGLRLLFSSDRAGGYEVEVEAASQVEPRGKRLRFAAGAPVAVRLAREVRLFGEPYRELYIYPHGAISLGAPLEPGARASAAAPGSLLAPLVSGPAVVAALWNELLPERAPPAGGVFLAQWPDEVAITWVDVPSARPAGAACTFRIALRRDGTVALDYGEVGSEWGAVGLAPPVANRRRVRVADPAELTELAPHEAWLFPYSDLPALDEIAVARRVVEQVPDRFEFLVVFTTEPVAGPHLVFATTVRNRDEGIGMPRFDDGALFGSRRLEHMVVMNALSFWAEDPSAPPREPSYAFAPSTLAVLAHELGHRWLSHVAGAGVALAGGEGHWSYFLDSDASLMGGNRLRANGDGTFTAVGAMEAFSPLDLYLMGLASPEEVSPFFLVEGARDFRRADGRPVVGGLTAAHRPEPGITFRGERVDLSAADVLAALGPRAPAASPRSFRVVFALVAPPGAPPSADDLAKLERIRRAFGPYFRRVTGGRARAATRLPPGAPEEPLALDPALEAGAPGILAVRQRRSAGGGVALEIDYADLDGDLAAVEVSTDATEDLPPARVDVAAQAFGSRRGTIALALGRLGEGASELRLALVDGRGERSAVLESPIAAGGASAPR